MKKVILRSSAFLMYHNDICFFQSDNNLNYYRKSLLSTSSKTLKISEVMLILIVSLEILKSLTNK